MKNINVELERGLIKKERKNPLKRNSNLGFIVRFMLLHVFTYTIVGLISLLVFNYNVIFEASPMMSLLMRSTDSPIVQAGILIQIVRGALLALAFCWLREIFVQKKNGWLYIFSMIFILTGIGAVITGPGSIEGMIYTELSISDHFGGGYIEIALQMLVFSLLLWRWERKIQI